MACRWAGVNDAPGPAKKLSNNRQSVTGPAVVSGSGKETPGMMPSTMPGYASAMSYCWIAPPEPPQPMVCATGPYPSMKCSLTIIAASAEMIVEQLLLSTLRVDDATA